MYLIRDARTMTINLAMTHARLRLTRVLLCHTLAPNALVVKSSRNPRLHSAIPATLPSLKSNMNTALYRPLMTTLSRILSHRLF